MAAITERIEFDDERDRTYLEWVVKNLASFIGGIAGDRKQGERLLDAAAKLTMFPEKGGVSTPGESRSDRPVAEPEPGSYEKLMGSLGRGGSLPAR